MEVIVSSAGFFAGKTGHYTEIYTMVPAWELQMAMDKDKVMKAKVQCTLIIRKDSSIVYADKYVLNSRAIKDSNDINFCLIDQKRIALKPGIYQLELFAKDVNDSSNVYKTKQSLHVQDCDARLSISDIELVESFQAASTENIYVKNGLELQPQVLEFYGDNMKKLNFYAEVYHSDLSNAGQKLLLKTILTQENGIPLADFGMAKKVDAAPVIPLMQTIDISNLKTGNYYLEISLIDQHGKTLASRSSFLHRLNLTVLDTTPALVYSQGTTGQFSWLDTASLNYLRFSAASLTPIADHIEVPKINEMIKTGSAEFIKNFLSNFWHKKEPLNAEWAWRNYEEKVMLVERNYSTSQDYGFNTDRGRIYLKYGPPNDLIRQKENGGFDYEMWHYYKLDAYQSNVKFVFYNPTMVYNAFELVTSNAIGEKNDPNWKQRIYGTYGNRDTQNLDNTNYNPHTGARVNQNIGDIR